MSLLISQTLWSRAEAPDALLLAADGEESWSRWALFARLEAEPLLARLRSRLLLRLGSAAWAELLEASRSGPDALGQALGGARPELWRQITLLTPPCSELPEESHALLLALRERGIRTCLGSLCLTRPALSLLAAAGGAELPIAALGAPLCSSLSSRLAQNKQWSFLSQADSRSGFRELAALGSGPFQGSALFDRPMANASGKPDVGARKVLRLLQMAYAEAELSELEDEIKQDAALSYKLISLLNSAGLRSQRSVGSAREALMMLGYSQLTQWLSLLLLSSSPSAQKQSALRFCLARRAKLCELLALSGSRPELAERAFVCGMLSGADALFDAPRAPLLSEAGLPEEIRLAIEARSGALGELLSCALAHESCPRSAQAQALALGIEPEAAARAHHEALLWALGAAPFAKL